MSDLGTVELVSRASGIVRAVAAGLVSDRPLDADDAHDALTVAAELLEALAARTPAP